MKRSLTLTLALLLALAIPAHAAEPYIQTFVPVLLPYQTDDLQTTLSFSIPPSIESRLNNVAFSREQQPTVSKGDTMTHGQSLVKSTLVEGNAPEYNATNPIDDGRTMTGLREMTGNVLVASGMQLDSISMRDGLLIIEPDSSVRNVVMNRNTVLINQGNIDELRLFYNSVGVMTGESVVGRVFALSGSTLVLDGVWPGEIAYERLSHNVVFSEEHSEVVEINGVKYIGNASRGYIPVKFVPGYEDYLEFVTINGRQYKGNPSQGYKPDGSAYDMGAMYSGGRMYKYRNDGRELTPWQPAVADSRGDSDGDSGVVIVADDDGQSGGGGGGEQPVTCACTGYTMCEGTCVCDNPNCGKTAPVTCGCTEACTECEGECDSCHCGELDPDICGCENADTDECVCDMCACHI